MWTVALVSTGCSGLWLAPRYWWGWLITSASEVLWSAYALHTHDHPLFIMALIWLALNLRGARVARKAHLRAVRSDVRADPGGGDQTAQAAPVPRLQTIREVEVASPPLAVQLSNLLGIQRGQQ